MIELLLAAFVTILPDYLYRRYGQGKRIGKEITLYSMWYELRWGIVTCLVLTVTMLTVIFYFHPSTKTAVTFFRIVPILPEGIGRVAEVYVGINDQVEAGQPLIRLDSAQQEAAVETARRRIIEVQAELAVAETDLAAADGRIAQAEGAYRQALDELETRQELRDRNPDTVPARQIEQLQVAVDGRLGAVEEASASKASIERRISTVFPAQQASAEAALAEAQVALDKTVVRAGVDGRVEQFVLQPGDIINPLLRPAGILVPQGAGRQAIIAGFDQLGGQVMRPGMAAEAVCATQPFAIIPLVVTVVQDAISSGQVGPTDQLVDALQVTQPGTLTVFLEPMFAGGLDGVTPGSNCLATAYTDNHDLLESGEVGGLRWLFLHAVDAVGVVKAGVLRINALIWPVQTLVLSGH